MTKLTAVILIFGLLVVLPARPAASEGPDNGSRAELSGSEVSRRFSVFAKDLRQRSDINRKRFEWAMRVELRDESESGKARTRYRGTSAAGWKYSLEIMRTGRGYDKVLFVAWLDSSQRESWPCTFDLAQMTRDLEGFGYKTVDLPAGHPIYVDFREFYRRPIGIHAMLYKSKDGRDCVERMSFESDRI